MALAPILFDAANWYWSVGGDKTQVFSSAAAAYVPAGDATYTAWLANPSHATSQIATEQELWDYLNGRVLDGTPATATSTDAAKDGRVRDQMSEVVGQILLNHENRIRALEGRAAVTRQQFVQGVKTLMK